MKPLPTSSAAQVASITSGRFGGRKKQVKALLELALSQWKQKNLRDALETAEAVRDLLNGDSGRPNREKSACLDLLGGISKDAGDAPLARQYLAEALEVERQIRPPDWARISELGRRLGAACQAAGDREEARRYFEEAVSDAENGLRPDHVAVGDSLAELGFFLQQGGENEAALPCLERALEIHRTERGASSTEVARDYEGLGLALQALGRYEESVGYYQKALYLRERQLGGDGTEMTAVMVSLAEIYSEWGRHSAAMELLQQATGRLEMTGDDRLAHTLEKLGVVYARCGRYEEAAGCYNRARDIFGREPGEHTAELANNATLLAGVAPHLREEEEQPVCRSQPQSGPTAPATARPGRPAAGIPGPAGGFLTPAQVPIGAWSGAETIPVAGFPEEFSLPLEPDRRGPQSGGAHLAVVVPESARPPEPIPPAREPYLRLEGWEELSFDLVATA